MSPRLPLVLAAATACILGGLAGDAHARALVGTTDDGNFGIFIPNPSQGLPNPQTTIVSGLPAGARPHGSAIVGVDRGLVADFANNRVFVVGLEPAQLVSTIPTPSYSGLGTLAVSPDRSVALASGFDPHVTVIRAPFGPGSVQSDIPLPAAIAGFATQNIDFDAQGRAYVRHVEGVSVIDPPYQAVAFTLPITSERGGGIAVSPDGSRLITGYVVADSGDALVEATPGRDGVAAASGESDVPAPSDLYFGEQLRGGAPPPGAGLDVAILPLSAASTFQRVELFRCNCYPAGVVITPDSQRALIALLIFDAQPGDPVVSSLPAPFTDSGALQVLPLPPGYPVGQGFEDIGLSADGSEAIIVGQSLSTVPGAPSGLPALHVSAPFTTAAAQLSALNLPGGRGAGSVRYAPLGTLPPPPPPPAAPALPVPVDGGIGLLLMLLGLLVLAGRRLNGARGRA